MNKYCLVTILFLCIGIGCSSRATLEDVLIDAGSITTNKYGCEGFICQTVIETDKGYFLLINDTVPEPIGANVSICKKKNYIVIDYQMEYPLL